MMIDQSPNDRLERVRPLWVITGALALWGLYLAIGATGAFTPGAGFYDLRKFFIVVACSAAFLAFWYGNLRLARMRKMGEVVDRPVSFCSWLALLMSLNAYGLWGLAYRVNEHLAVRLGLVSAVLFGCSMIAAMIGLSDRAPKTGKRAGLAAFLMFLVAIILFVVQVNAYINRQ
jgi:hypothetical protein